MAPGGVGNTVDRRDRPGAHDAQPVRRDETIIRVGVAAARTGSAEQRAGGFCEGQLGDRRRPWATHAMSPGRSLRAGAAHAMSPGRSLRAGSARATSPGRLLRPSWPSLAPCRLHFALRAALAGTGRLHRTGIPSSAPAQLRRRMRRPAPAGGGPRSENRPDAGVSREAVSHAQHQRAEARKEKTARSRSHPLAAWHDATLSTSGRRPAKKKRHEAVFFLKPVTAAACPAARRSPGTGDRRPARPRRWPPPPCPRSCRTSSAAVRGWRPPPRAGRGAIRACESP